MKPTNRNRIALALAISLALLFVYALVPQKGDWRGITVTFAGFTNTPNTRLATLLIHNPTSTSVWLMDHYYVQWAGMWLPPSVSNTWTRIPTATNHIIGEGDRYPTGTNLVVGSHSTAALLIHVPPEGTNWVVSLEFARANLQTRLAQYLKKTPRGFWNRFIPNSPYVRSFYLVRSASCELSDIPGD